MVSLARILIADDEPVFLGTTADLLKLKGYECDCVSDAAEATAMLRKHRYDLLISDIKMPGNCQLELVAQIRELAEHTPVILVTGFPSIDTAVTAVKLPVADYLIKPVDFDELLARVRECVTRSQVLRSTSEARKHLADWSQSLQDMGVLFEGSADKQSWEAVNAFVTMNLNRVAEILVSFSRLTEDLARNRPEHERWQIVASAQLDTAYNALSETVRALRETKQLVKSKPLARMRHKLQVLLDDWPSRPE